MKRTYKVWIEVEELDSKGDPTGRDLGILPDSLGSFASLKKATAKVAEVVGAHGVDPRNPDGVKANAVGKGNGPGRAPKKATCSLCGKPCDAGKAHLHQGKLIGDECCWDERLKASE